MQTIPLRFLEAGFFEPRLRGFPRSGLGPSLRTGSVSSVANFEPRLRGFSLFGLS